MHDCTKSKKKKQRKTKIKIASYRKNFFYSSCSDCDSLVRHKPCAFINFLFDTFDAANRTLLSSKNHIDHDKSGGREITLLLLTW